MCGRYIQIGPWSSVVEFFNLIPSTGVNLRPRYNIAPTQDVPVVRAGSPGRELVHLRWGLVPRWHREPGRGTVLINARLETVAEKPSFRSAYRARRCLLPADGWYEWRAIRGGKQPVLVTLAGRRPFAFAGIWERWEGNGTAIESVAILTMEATPALRAIHHRMPAVIADPGRVDAWLSDALGDTDRRRLLEPGGLAFESHDVSRAVNDVRHDAPDCIEPFDPEPEGTGPGGTGFLF
jgi:putative SOS response-associated peptidase YedK